MSAGRPTLVLVPGARHRPDTFDRLRGELDALGYATRAVKLPTTGPDPRGGLHDDAAAIRDAVEALAGPVVVMAHGYGGVPATEGVPDGVRRLIYLAAHVPDVGESMYSLQGLAEPASPDGLYQADGNLRARLYTDLPELEGALAVSRLVDQLNRPFTDRVTRAAWRTVPSSYIVTERDNAMPVGLQEEMAARASEVHYIYSGHTPFLSRPVVLATLLDIIVKWD